MSSVSFASSLASSGFAAPSIAQPVATACAVSSAADALIHLAPDFTDADLDNLLLQAAVGKVSDITIHDGLGVIFKQASGEQTQVTRQLTGSDAARMLSRLYRGANAMSELGQRRSLDFRYEVRTDGMGGARGERVGFRVNAIACNSPFGDKGCHITLRVLPQQLPRLEDMHLAAGIRDSLLAGKGLIAVVGDTGQGKSTLLAAIVREIVLCCEDRKVTCFESPVEYDFEPLNRQMPFSHGSFVIQSDVGADGRHLPSFEAGIRAALREGPTDIFIGEARDRETIDAALLASESGHAALFTVHATSVRMAVERLCRAYPSEAFESTVYKVVGQLRVVLCQRLAKTPNKLARRPVREWLILDEAYRRRLLALPTAREVLLALENDVLAAGHSFRDQAMLAFEAGQIGGFELPSFGLPVAPDVQAGGAHG